MMQLLDQALQNLSGLVLPMRADKAVRSLITTPAVAQAENMKLCAFDLDVPQLPADCGPLDIGKHVLPYCGPQFKAARHGLHLSEMGSVLQFFSEQSRITREWIRTANFEALGLTKFSDIRSLQPLPDGSFPNKTIRQALGTISSAKKVIEEVEDIPRSWLEEAESAEARCEEWKEKVKRSNEELAAAGLEPRTLEWPTIPGISIQSRASDTLLRRVRRELRWSQEDVSELRRRLPESGDSA
ncbi:hypothetical protein BD324DRAFT_425703 [Kockovaella imperatae]|uniref:Uncharacterized protein n=1 Tax=Kockovaella imperatae TaxID=4999 RepID=A0A1Y1UGA3_9TREE|nr:hypothetical protein BD324DRAFT_425703 [Kockovaella imperatae]ORX37100.1 hypothetical protein BD324DRAFT_425703 [Kockovaella imperatae]